MAAQGLTRRRFLRASGKVALATGLAGQLEWLAACGGTTESDWGQLEKRLTGRLVRPRDADYGTLSLPYNRRYAAVRPQGIALVESPADVRDAILWSREHDVPIAARAGGHSYAGFSNTAGLLVDVRKLNGIEVDPRTGVVTIGAGARLGQVYDALQPHNVTVPAGRCPTVGISGLVLGGGFGFSSRTLGLTCDSLLATDAVLASGEVVAASERERDDLFWASRGGGGGNFGINTSFRVRAHPVDKVALFALTWPWDDAPRVLSAFQKVVEAAPDEFSARLGMNKVGGGPAARKRPPLMDALGQFFGSADRLRELLDPVLEVARPSTKLIDERTFWQAKKYFASTTPRGRFEVKSSYVAKPFSEEGIAKLLRFVETWPATSNPDGGGSTLFAWGGQIGRVPVEATAFSHRHALFLMDYNTAWGPHDPGRLIDAGLDWIARFHEQMQPYVADQAYQNFMDRSQPDWQRAYYGPNFPRLVEVKRRYDPDDVFSFGKGIPTRA